MAENIPSSLRTPSRRTAEINDILEKELNELREFTMYENQLLRVEKGCTDLEEKNLQLVHEVNHLNKIVQRREHALKDVKNIIQKKKIRFSSLKDDASLLAGDSLKEGAVSPTALINEVLATFDTLSEFVENDSVPEENRRNLSLSAADILNITGEEVQNEVSKLRQILRTSFEEEARRLSDSFQCLEKRKSKGFGNQDVAIQTEDSLSSRLVNVDVTSHLLDISNVSVDGRWQSDNLKFASNVEELEKKLLEIREQCQILTSANEDLERLLDFKNEEIQELNERLNIPKSPCICRKSGTIQEDDEYADISSCSIQPIINSSCMNMSSLPTIPEVKESSFDGSFDENNVPDFTAPQVNMCGIVRIVDPETDAAAPQRQGEGLLDKYRAEIADLQKCRDLLADELDYCLSELDVRDEQITLLQSAVPAAHVLCAGISTSSDLFKQCNEEMESLETLVGGADSADRELDAEVTGRLVNVLNMIQKGMHALFAVSAYPSLEPSCSESSFANMSTTLSNTSSYPQQFCSVLLESTVDVSINDSSLSPNIVVSKPDTILKDVRNLRKCVELITTDVTREFFSVVSQLERVESLVLRFKNVDPEGPESSVDCTKPLNSYRNVLIRDIREKAKLILDFQRSRPDEQCKDSSACVSAQSSDESLLKPGSRHTSGSVLSSTNSSVYVSAAEGDEANLHFMCPTDSKCDNEAQTSFVYSNAMLSTTNGVVDCSVDNDLNSADPSIDTLKAETADQVLFVFWRTVNDFNAVLQGLGIPTSKTVPENQTLTLEKIESYAESVIEVLNLTLKNEPLSSSSHGDEQKYDPDCTKLLSLEISCLNDDDCRTKPLRTSALFPANQNTIDRQHEKENYPDDKGAPSKTIKNWEKLIHDSNKRIGELLNLKNNVHLKLSEKIADNNNLVQQLNKAQSELESYQEVVREKTGLVDELTSLVANKDVQMENVKRRISIVQEDASKLGLELNTIKGSWNQMTTDFKNLYLELSDKIDTFLIEIGDLQKEKSEADDCLTSARITIEEIERELRNKVEKMFDLEKKVCSLNDHVRDKDQLRASLQATVERLAKELAEKEKHQNDLINVTDLLSTAENKIVELEEAMLHKTTRIQELEEAMIHNTSRIQELEDSEMTQIVHMDRIKNREHDVTVLTKTLEDTRAKWNKLIVSSSEEIEHLKTAMKHVEVQLAFELSGKQKLQNNLLDATVKLSTAVNKIIELEDSEAAQILHQDRIKNLEQAVSALTKTSEETRSKWNTLIISSSQEVDQLKTAVKTVEVQLAMKLAEKTEFERVLHCVEHKLSASEKRVSDLESHVTEMNEALLEKISFIRDLEACKFGQSEHISRIAELQQVVDGLELVPDDLNQSSQAEIDRLKVSLEMVVEQLSKGLVEKEKFENNSLDAADRLCTAENKIAELEGTIIEKISRIQELEDSEMANIVNRDRIEDLGQDVSALTKTLEETRAKWNTLIASSSKEIDQLKTAMKHVEVQLALELVKEMKLEDALYGVELKLSTSESRVADLETDVTEMNQTLLEKISFIRDLEACETEQIDHIRRITELQKVVDSLKSALDDSSVSSSVEIHNLKVSLEMTEIKLVQEVAEKEKIQNDLIDATDRLSAAENKITELEEAMLYKTENSEMTQSLYQNQIANLEQDVTALTKTLEATRSKWNMLIFASSKEIDQLKTAMNTGEVRIAKEIVKVTKLDNRVTDAEQRFSDLARETSEMKETLLEKISYMTELEATKISQNEHVTRITELEQVVESLKASLIDTNKSSRSEIDQLKLSLKTAEEQLYKGLAEKEILENTSKDVTGQLSIAMKAISDLERERDDVNQVLARTNDDLRKLEETTAMEKENLSKSLEEALGHREELKQTLIKNEDHFNSVLTEQEKLFSDKSKELDLLKVVASNFRSQLTVAQDSRRKLILETNKGIDEMNTSKKRSEVGLMLETVERNKVSTKLEAASAEIEDLREGLQTTYDMIRDMKNHLTTLKYLQDDDEALNETNYFADARDVRNDLLQVILRTKQKFSELCEAERSLSVQLSEEKTCNMQLSAELLGALSTITELRGEIHRNSDESSVSLGVSDPFIKSTSRQNQSVVGRSSLSNEDDFELTTCNATVHFERSVFVSDLAPMEQTVFGDNFDPLSMTINPDLATTPFKMDAGHDSSGESEFGTPEANKFWEGSETGNSPCRIGAGEKTPVGRKNISASVTKNLAHLAAISEIADLRGRIETYETDMVSLQAKIDETSASHEQLSQRMVTIQTLVDGVLKAFYNRIPELPIEQNIVNISKDVANLTNAVIESTGCAQSCLIDAVNMLITDGLPASSLMKDSIVSANSKIEVITKDMFALKEEMQQFSQLLNTELVSTISCVEQNLSCLGAQITRNNAIIDELKQANDTLQDTLLTASLEKEYLRDQLNGEISRFNSLKCSVEEREKELETKYTALRDECDENLICRQNIESIILELLHQWNGDEEVVSKDVVQELKSVFGEAICTKNIMKARMNKTINFLTDVEGILSKNDLLEDSLLKLKSQLSTECKNLAIGVKNIQDESSSLLVEYTSSQREIQEALQGAQSAVSALSAELLRNLSSNETCGILKGGLRECQDRIANYETTIDEASSKCTSLTEKVRLLEENNCTLSTANEALIKDVSISETRNKELFEKLEELQVSNGVLSSEMAKLQQNIVDLSEKLSANELKLSLCEEHKLQANSVCSLCEQRELKLENIRKTLIDVLDSTGDKPINLSSSSDDVVEKLLHAKSVLTKSNDVMHSVLKLFDSEEPSGVIALECLYRHLKSKDIRDAYLCKMKLADEIHCMEPEMTVEELLQLSLLDLQNKLVSVVMEKEAKYISDFKEEYESRLASQAHQLSQYEDKIKYKDTMMKDLEKEIVKLEETLSDALKKKKVEEEESEDLEKFINAEEKTKLINEITTLNSQISKLKCEAGESADKFKLWIYELENILKKFLESLIVQENVPGSLAVVDFGVNDKNFPNQLAEVLRGIFSRFNDMRMLYVSVVDKCKEASLAAEHFKSRFDHLENEHALCEKTKFKLVDLQEELATKELTLSALNVDYQNLETQLKELKQNNALKENEVVSAEKASQELELEQSRKHIDELKSRLIAVSRRSTSLSNELKSLSSHCMSIKVEFLKFQNEATTENEKILISFQNLSKQFEFQIKEEQGKSVLLKTEIENLHGLLLARNEENSMLHDENKLLENSLAKESAEKLSLAEQLKKLENASVRVGHDDKSCPHKEKAQEYKKELWIIRQKSADEQKKFDVMKKNIEEDLAFKANIIKKLEERNETTVSQFNLRLASSTTSYNQACKQLEAAEEKILFLRDMNSQDKNRLEKEIDNLNKEISRLQSVKMFTDDLGIDCEALQEKLPEIKKKLSEFENLQTMLSELTEKNTELEEECEFMNKQIDFLESRNAEMYKQNLEDADKLQKLEKELTDVRGLVDRNKQLQAEVDSLKASESKRVKSLDESQTRLDQLMTKLSEVELEKTKLQTAYKLVETNLESRAQKILHYVSEMKNYEAMLTEKTRLNQELRLALEEERSKYVELAHQKSCVEKDLIGFQKELVECQARLKELGLRLEEAAGVEASLLKVSAERDEALRSYNDLKSKLPIAQQVIREKESMLESLRVSYDQLATERKENEDILKAREKELVAEMEALKTAASDKATRIVQLESVMEQLQTPVDVYDTKISSLEMEVECLKKELVGYAVGACPPPQHVTVEPTSLSNKLDTKTREEFERAIHKLEKTQVVLKRLCKSRREKILLYQEVLKHHNIQDPNASREHSL